MADAQSGIEAPDPLHRHGGVQKDFGDPRHHDEDENENVIAFQAPPDRLELADLEGGQNQILADELLPFALEHRAILHHHRNEKMRFEHADARTKRVVETVTPRFDPKHAPDNREVEKENDVRHVAIRKRDGDNGGAAGDGPVRGDVEALAPDHDAAEFAPI